ncbi:hypothetical protein [Caulobacter sp. UNC279MFTsu5.1]|uniref:hypothetical protein n=1 Tax=Caulobacter sp. UNC279MFTsu5.1 TaxID=1502775 RepID=UPI0008F4507F|nr:hypothetical protein [Caulobacter sp. UNC279MFTsu5.1]SFI51606.1 hypothetical protein SAMN02799626_00010 [Caulobacter sp. UNC279MFTsu5.1]
MSVSSQAAQETPREGLISPKGFVLTEAASPDTAQRLSGLKKAELVAAAEPDLVKARWLPVLLRTRSTAPPQWAEETASASAPDHGQTLEDAAETASAAELAAAE